jgi:hypothetical protein
MIKSFSNFHLNIPFFQTLRLKLFIEFDPAPLTSQLRQKALTTLAFSQEGTLL